MKFFFKKLLIYFMIIAFLVVVIDYGLGKVVKSLEKKEKNYFPRLRWADFYEQEENTLDVVFIGSSHCYRTFSPEVFDSITHKVSFNLGSSAQSPVTTYFVLQQLFKKQSPESIIFEIYPSVWLSENYSTAAKFNFEFITDPTIKREMFFNGFKDNSEAILLNFPIARYKQITRYIMKMAFGKGLNLPHDEYRTKGFVATHKECHEDFEPWELDLDKVVPKQMEYIDKIKKLCLEKGTQLTFVISPYNPDHFVQCKNYQDINNKAMEISNGFPFYDFNKHSKSFDPVIDFYDSGHTSSIGAKKLTTILANQYLAGTFDR